MKTTTKRPRFRYSLRAFLMGVTLACVWLGFRVHHARQQKAAIAVIESVGGYFYYEYQFDPPDTYYPANTTPGPDWFWRIVDSDLIFDVVAVGLNAQPATDETVRIVSRLGHLEQLDVAGAPGVTNRSMAYLEPLDRLNYLRLDGTSVDSTAMDEFQRKRPNVQLIR